MPNIVVCMLYVGRSIRWRVEAGACPLYMTLVMWVNLPGHKYHPDSNKSACSWADCFHTHCIAQYRRSCPKPGLDVLQSEDLQTMIPLPGSSLWHSDSLANLGSCALSSSEIAGNANRMRLDQ